MSRLKRPRDPVQRAKLICDIAVGIVKDDDGKARAAKLSPAERSAIARKAAAARWKNRG